MHRLSVIVTIRLTFCLRIISLTTQYWLGSFEHNSWSFSYLVQKTYKIAIRVLHTLKAL